MAGLRECVEGVHLWRIGHYAKAVPFFDHAEMVELLDQWGSPQTCPARALLDRDRDEKWLRSVMHPVEVKAPDDRVWPWVFPGALEQANLSVSPPALCVRATPGDTEGGLGFALCWFPPSGQERVERPTRGMPRRIRCNSCAKFLL